ncbi:hypothetical protein EC991_000897 [Linnemannia zychae]|nr:hypothetical protein EC991_000897 [Linnemannia zychae]
MSQLLPKDDLPFTKKAAASTLCSTKLATLVDLPPEILSNIASYITSTTDLLSCLVVHSNLLPHFVQKLWKTINLRSFKRFKTLAINTGALHKNGRFVRSLKYVQIEWLPYFGIDTCPALEEIAIVNMTTAENIGILSDFFQQQSSYDSGSGTSSSIRKLYLSEEVLLGLSNRDILADTRRCFLDILRMIPASVEELELWDLLGYVDRDHEYWHRARREALAESAVSTFQKQDLARRQEQLSAPAGAATTLLPASLQDALLVPSTFTQQASTNDAISAAASATLWLPGIKKLVFTGLVATHSLMAPLYRACPNLESLSYFGSVASDAPDLALLLRTHCPKLTSLTMSRSSGDRFGFPNPTDLPVLLYASIETALGGQEYVWGSTLA